jgi:two-component system cell cycle response regulator
MDSQANAPDGSKRRILLAEDDAAVLKMTRLRLEHEGFDVIVATNGEEALRRAEEHQDIALALVDVRMPKLDGFQVCKRMKADPRMMHIPIIVFTASVSQLQRLTDRCIELGASGWLRKPFRSKDLMDKIHNTLREEGGSDGG